MGTEQILPPDDDPERLATIRRLGGCTGRGRMHDLERRAHDPHDTRDSLERSPVAEAVLGVVFLGATLLAVYGLWCAARDLIRLIS